MTFRDQLRYAFGNLRKTRLRTFLTAAGVSIGIGAMSSMVSVGVGMQENVLRQLNQENLLTTISVTPIARGGIPGARQDPDAPRRDPDLPPQDPDAPPARRRTARSPSRPDSLGPPPLLDDAAIQRFRSIPGVRDAFPSITIPGLLGMGDRREFTTLQGMPTELMAEQSDSGRITLVHGRVFASGERDGMVLSRRTAESFLPEGASLDSLIGQRVTFAVMQAGSGGSDSTVSRPGAESGAADPADLLRGLDLPPAFRNLPLGALLRGMGGGDLIRTVRLDFTILGIVEGVGQFGDFLGTALYVPLEVVQPLYGTAFRSLESLMTGSTRGGEYRQAEVLAQDVGSVRGVQEAILAAGYHASSILDEFRQVRRAFAIMNGFLALLGGISLLVAAMMIVNTLVMAVLERTREIGLLKSLGATDRVVSRLFLTEAGAIGLLGGVGGLILGSVVAHVTNFIANIQIYRESGVRVDLVSFPLWLLAGAIGFAILVSVVAGVYPARRAARVDPVVALRHF